MAQIKKADIIHRLCELLMDNKKNEGADFVNGNYPFIEIEQLHSRQYTRYEMIKVYLKDGFIDRYSGERLLFPGLIRLLSLELPDIFKYHANWKMSETHMIYWDLFPTVDHIVPIARGGSNNEGNWITTSQLRNSAKSNFTLDELGWEILPNGSLKEWDGLCSLFMQWIISDNLEDKYKHTEDWKYISGWKDALVKAQNIKNITPIKSSTLAPTSQAILANIRGITDNCLYKNDTKQVGRFIPFSELPVGALFAYGEAKTIYRKLAPVGQTLGTVVNLCRPQNDEQRKWSLLKHSELQRMVRLVNETPEILNKLYL